jgi:peptidoglycan/xylan/chitin deacetylase (PgdA/CDA1 family)
VNPWPIVLPATVGVAAGIAAWGAVHPASQLFGPALCRTAQPSAIGLTFDDGPNPAVTPQLLALLDRHGARATFFVVGRFARRCPELVREISARGHLIGNHTETHANLTFRSPARIQEELLRCRDSIASAAHLGAASPPMWMRPPFGFSGPQLRSVVRRVGLRGVVLWSLTVYDWKPQPAARLIARLDRVTRGMTAADGRNTARGGEIVLLHDGDFRQLGADRRHMLTALEHWLPRWRDAGLEFVTMDQAAGVASVRG